jgi:peroxiredoxin Q/BCP
MRLKYTLVLCIIVSMVLSFFYACDNDSALKDQTPQPLAVGDQVPMFQANDQDGNLWQAKDYLGKKLLVVYFYPAAMTGGCTKQACGFRDDKNGFNQYKVEVVGVSGDAVVNLKYFRQAEQLNFTLLSDVSGNITKMFGVPVNEGGSITREIAGNEVLLHRAFTPARWTFVIDKAGSVVYKNTEVDAEKDSKTVVEFLEQLSS